MPIMTNQDYVEHTEELKPFLRGADHVDVKMVESSVDLRNFLAAMFSYFPGWLRFLYRIRAVFVRFLGLRQQMCWKTPRLTPKDIPMQVNASMFLGKVCAVKEPDLWILEISDKHLVKLLENGKNRYRVVTIVHYRHWTGPVYFNVVRPFHHIVVSKMAKAGANGVINQQH